MDHIERCRAYRRRILEISQRGPAHVAPALSCVEIVDLAYTLKRPQDIFVLSKGHGCLAQYVVLEALGILPAGEPGILYGGHPDRGLPGIEASTGSLGHGLGMAVGMAYAEYLKGTDNKVYAVISDGELQEGSTWEAVQMAANLKLDNLIVFVDANDFGGLARISESHPAVHPVQEKFLAFWWDAVDVNGHDSEAMKWGIVKGHLDKPFALICHTVKGKGVSFMENKPIWHYRSPNDAEYRKALRKLG